MADDLTEQISKLRKRKWINLQGLVDCATTYLSSIGSTQTCVSISFLRWGIYNIDYRLVFSDGTELDARVPNDPILNFDARRRQSEIDTMKFVRESGLYPDIPVPKVHAWDNTYTNPVGAPYILIDAVQGVVLDELAERDKWLWDLDTLPYAQQMSIVKAMAKLTASLSKPVPFDKIGSITMDATGKHHTVGPLITTKLRLEVGVGPFKSPDELWRFVLKDEITHAIHEWCNLKEDQLSQTIQEPECTPQKFSELYQLLASLIPHFRIPSAYSHLVLHHPDITLRNIAFDKESLSSEEAKITSIFDWRDSQILPLMLSAQYPPDLISTGDNPCPHSGYSLNEDWDLVPFDWTSVGELDTQDPEAGSAKYDAAVSAMVRRFYLRAHFSACYVEQLHRLSKDRNLAHATVFLDAPYYLKFHETVCGGWMKWVAHANWIRETYWRLRTREREETDDTLIIGPNIYRGSVKPMLCDLSISEDFPCSG